MSFFFSNKLHKFYMNRNKFYTSSIQVLFKFYTSCYEITTSSIEFCTNGWLFTTSSIQARFSYPQREGHWRLWLAGAAWGAKANSTTHGHVHHIGRNIKNEETTTKGKARARKDKRMTWKYIHYHTNEAQRIMKDNIKQIMNKRWPTWKQTPSERATTRHATEPWNLYDWLHTGPHQFALS